ncbi:hypothetical protein HY415_01870 [Candidatus Kaiserbacteria bacterium]|nr:hypothetical protein [Candidatus Kaiserbacteria bacterium]
MSFFSGLFKKKDTESVVLIDINADSVAGAYAYYEKGQLPVLHYTRRLPIEVRASEPKERAMLRALQILGETLLREGGSALVRATGSGRVDRILVSIDAPWQKTSIRTEYFEQKTPFVFSKRLMSAALERAAATPPGQLLADESIVGTILNGYETHNPYGKQAFRASIVILTSLIDERVAKSIHSVLQSLYRVGEIVSIAGSSLHYQAMRIMFPHERDALILDASGSSTSIALVRRELLVDLRELITRAADISAWQQKVLSECAQLAEKFPLPRTIFLLAPEPKVSALREALDTANLRDLWLSDNPPTIVSVLAGQQSGFVRQAPEAPPDILLLLMALFYQAKKWRVT